LLLAELHGFHAQTAILDIHRGKGHGAITMSKAVLHVLSAGNRFDLIERKLLPNEAWTRKVEAGRRR
jgi:hypothetical protein